MGLDGRWSRQGNIRWEAWSKAAAEEQSCVCGGITKEKEMGGRFSKAFFLASGDGFG